VAVAVVGTPCLVLDERYNVVAVGDAALAEFGQLLGRNLWEGLPGAEQLFRPHYESAWRTREPVEFVQFYEGRVEQVRAVPRDDRLEISWTVLAQLDTLTLDGLRSSISDAISTLEESQTTTSGSRRTRLRLVQGTP
jgi:hypothetical protein